MAKEKLKWKYEELYKNKKVSDISNELSISNSTVYSWINNKKPILIKDGINREDINLILN